MLKEVSGRDVPLLIDNKDIAGEGAELKVIDPVTEEVVADFKGASVEQVDQACRAAAHAFQSAEWADPQFRKSVLERFADLLVQHRDELMDTLYREIASPATLQPNHIDTPAAFTRWFAAEAVKERDRDLGFNAARTGVSTIAYRPVGVVATISAFNYPLLIGVTKSAAAMAAGCTVVLLSSPQAPLALARMGQLVREAGFPPGVFNIIAGGADAGQALTTHPAVDKISFTGSVNVGKMVMRQASDGLRGVVLELGGKSAAILLPGTDYEKFAFQLHARYARNAGQGCGSPTRILIEESRYDEFCEASRKAYQKLKVGDPREGDTILGPVISERQRDFVEGRVAEAVERGAEIIAGGGRPDINKGWFMNPVLVGRLDNQDLLAREELFGPVSVVLTYKTVDEAIEIANDSELGLKAYIFGDRAECLRLAPRLRVGTVQINGGSPLRPDAPMNGWKLSGLGAEWGEDGLREFLAPQHIDVAV